MERWGLTAPTFTRGLRREQAKGERRRLRIGGRTVIVSSFVLCDIPSPSRWLAQFLEVFFGYPSYALANLLRSTFHRAGYRGCSRVEDIGEGAARVLETVIGYRRFGDRHGVPPKWNR